MKRILIALIFMTVVGVVGWFLWEAWAYNDPVLPRRLNYVVTPQPIVDPTDGKASSPGLLRPDDTGDAQQSHASTVRPVLDLDYDDSWVVNVPDTIGEYRVIRIGTPKDVSCSSSPRITLQAPQESMEEHLATAPNVRSLLELIPGIPSDVQLNFVGSALSEEEAAASLEKWNEDNLQDGCIQLGSRSGRIEWPEPSDEPQ